MYSNEKIIPYFFNEKSRYFRNSIRMYMFYLLINALKPPHTLLHFFINLMACQKRKTSESLVN